MSDTDPEPNPGMLGGVFGLQDLTLSKASNLPPFASGHTKYFLNLRCALKVFCEANPPRSVWLPAYLCGSLLDSFAGKNIPIRYYGIDLQLGVEADGWIDAIEPGDMVIAIHYFGFTMRHFPASRAAARGATIIEDASQALFLPQQYPESACILYSPRKFMGVPDGGIMVSRSVTGTESIPLDAPPAGWWSLAFAAVQKRRDFDLAGGSNEWFSLFQRSEAEFPLGPYQASELSRILLCYGADYETIRLKRRQNYLRLLEHLQDYAIFADLSPDNVPLGFPVHVDPDRRDRMLQRLYQRRVYAPVHWRLDGIVPASFQAAHRISCATMTLICDQRYTVDDMDRQANEFKKAVRD